MVSLNGRWKGFIEQNIGLEIIEVGVEMVLCLDGNNVLGKLDIDINNDSIPPDVIRRIKEASNMYFHGTIRGGRFIHFGLADNSASVINFGSMLLEITHPGETMEGLLIGYSPTNEKTILGNAHFYYHGYESLEKPQDPVFENNIIINPGAITNVTGEWKGVLEQLTINEAPIEFGLVLRLRQEGKMLSGTFEINSKKQIFTDPRSKLLLSYTVDISGRLHGNRFLHLDYANRNPDFQQFGTLIYEVLNPSVHLDGMFIGYGPVTNSLVMGTSHLDKRIMI